MSLFLPFFPHLPIDPSRLVCHIMHLPVVVLAVSMCGRRTLTYPIFIIMAQVTRGISPPELHTRIRQLIPQELLTRLGTLWWVLVP